jgi:hypothetical protein
MESRLELNRRAPASRNARLGDRLTLGLSKADARTINHFIHETGLSRAECLALSRTSTLGRGCVKTPIEL